MGQLNLYWFSGTGNTKIIVDTFAREMQSKGVEVLLHNIEDTKPEDVDTSATVGIAFPVAVFGTYPFVWDFITNLPKVNGTDIFMIDTLGGFSGGIVGPTKRVVKKKGYNPLGAIEVIMPNNYFVKNINENKNEDRVSKGVAKITQFANDLYNGTTKWGRVPILSDMVSFVSTMGIAWKGVRQSHTFVVDEQTCTGCEICVKLCPVDNLSINEKGIAVYSDQCIVCMRCTSFCPVEAITIPKKSYENYKGVKANELKYIRGEK